MKRKIVALLLAFTLFGAPVQLYAQEETETETEQSTELECNSMTLDEITYIKSISTDGLTEALGKVLYSIGIRSVDKYLMVNYEELGEEMFNLGLKCVIDGDEVLLATGLYDNGEWTLLNVREIADGTYYYLSDDTESDIIVEEYDGPTGETESGASSTSKKVSELEFSGELIVDVVEKDMSDWYDYIKDVYITVDESEKEIDIVVQVPSATSTDTAKMAGEDVARYLASMACSANSYYDAPGSDYLGGIYDSYDLLIYVDDGYKNFNLYGAKVTSASKITW